MSEIDKNISVAPERRSSNSAGVIELTEQANESSIKVSAAT